MDDQVTEHVAVVGDSSSGAVPTHIAKDGLTEITIVSPYHYYRTAMDSVEAFTNAGDDSPIVSENNQLAMVDIVSGPTKVNDSTWTITVRAPDQVGNWIATFRTIGAPYTLHGRRYGKRPRTVQLRLSTKPPIEEYVKGL